VDSAQARRIIQQVEAPGTTELLDTGQFGDDGRTTGGGHWYVTADGARSEVRDYMIALAKLATKDTTRHKPGPHPKEERQMGPPKGVCAVASNGISEVGGKGCTLSPPETPGYPVMMRMDPLCY
jgi:hypothetical protein